MSMLKFNTSLNDDDWDNRVGGWRCDALLIPEIQIDSLYYDGKEADSKDYSIANSIIRWTPSGNRPKQLSLLLSIPKNSINIEREKLELEKKNSSIKNKISIASILSAIITSSLTFRITYYLKFSQVEINPPRIHTYFKSMNISQDNCVNLLTNKLSNYGLTNITSIQGGVYGIKEKHNIFVGCNSQTQTISVVVAGSNDTETKQIRDDIKSFLP